MAGTSNAQVSVVNYALVTCLGLPPKFSIDGETKLGGIVDLVWPNVVDQTFGIADWTFCRRTSKLNRRDEAPITGWKYAFDLPDDKVGDPLKLARDGFCEQPIHRFDLEGLQVHCNEDAVFARCRVLVDPEYWDPAFRACFVTALGSALAVPLLQDTSLRDDLYQEAFGTPSQGGSGGVFGRLIAQNEASAPKSSPFTRHDPLTAARW